VVDVVVELLERRHQFRALADLRADWDELARVRLDEVPMRWNVGDEQVGWISDAGAGKREECDRRDRADS
jgi:hypothetical protein